MVQFQLIEHGRPGVWELVEKPPLQPDAGEVVIRVRYCGLNHLDLWMEAGALPVSIQLPRVGGGEVSGHVIRCAPDVDHLKPGMPVAVQSNQYCGECDFCRAGDHSQCLNSRLLGVHRDGGFASEICVPSRLVHPLPDSLDLADAASVLLAGSTAMHMLTDRVKVREGQWVLVMGANSGVGSYAIQIACSLGAKVIATASSPEKESLARRLGATHVVNHRTDSWPAEVRRITSKKGVDIIVEHIGGSILESCFHCLARGGTVVTCGATAGKDIHLNLWPFFVKEQRLTGSYGRTREDFLRTIDWLLEGRIRPVIDSIFRLEDAMAAMAKLRDGRALGKVLVAP